MGGSHKLSRSRKKYPIIWIGANLARKDKKRCNRILRQKSKNDINTEEPLISLKELQNKIGGGKFYKTDGKIYIRMAYCDMPYRRYLK